MNWRQKASELSSELADSRETNRLLHRRLQATEGPLQGRILHLEWWADYQGKHADRAMRRCSILETELEKKHGFLFIEKLRKVLKNV